MSLLRVESLALSYGWPPLLEDVSLRIDRGERVCLLGRNGTGKSTLLRILAGGEQGDSGQFRLAAGARVARLAQEPEADCEGSVFEVVARGLGALGERVSEYFRLTHEVAAAPSEFNLQRLAAVQQELETAGGWVLEQRTERVISRLGLDGAARFDELSGGQQRRAMLARALVIEPDLLLLDEPTNHLDIETIAWLEEFLRAFTGALLFVTHDRRFLQNLATRILELDRGRLTDWPGDYDNYLRRREERAHAEQQATADFERRLAAEEVWIRQGIKARRTRNEGRVRALEALREEARTRRHAQGQARLRLAGAEASGKLVVEAEGLSHAWGDRLVIRELDTLILRGDKVGIIGPNGVGKSTLLRLLLGELPPQSGRLRLGSNLRAAYFDQQRAQLDLGRSVQDNVAGGSDQIEVPGGRRHVLSYLQDFLFTPERARQPAGALSGGERNRLLLAKLFTRPANVLVLDEPTNDLDVETLELLEELLLDFAGTLLLVSHDRALIDRVATSTLVFEGEGRVREYVGGYSDWLRQRPPPEASAPASPAEARERAAPVRRVRRPVPNLTHKERQELAQWPARIEALETEQARLQTTLADPDVYRTQGETIVGLRARLEALESELEAAYARWGVLEARDSRQASE